MSHCSRQNQYQPYITDWTRGNDLCPDACQLNQWRRHQLAFVYVHIEKPAWLGLLTLMTWGPFCCFILHTCLPFLPFIPLSNGWEYRLWQTLQPISMDWLHRINVSNIAQIKQAVATLKNMTFAKSNQSSFPPRNSTSAYSFFLFYHNWVYFSLIYDLALAALEATITVLQVVVCISSMAQ